MTDALFANASAIATLMLVVWLASLGLRNAAIIDLVWGAGFALVAWVTFFTTDPAGRRVLLPLLTTAWGLRLSLYLARRNHGKPEDFRYRAMREKHGHWFPLVSLFTVFLLQGVIMWIVSLPLQTATNTGPPDFRFMIPGILLWAIGLFFESVGDWQLAGFKRNPANAGRVMDHGLWRYTRHPNYFGDFCVWWGLFLVAVAIGAPWWTIVGPIVMSLFLMRISGVTLLERSLNRTKIGYADYAERTNAFFPWAPRPARSQSERVSSAEASSASALDTTNCNHMTGGAS